MAFYFSMLWYNGTMVLWYINTILSTKQILVVQVDFLMKY